MLTFSRRTFVRLGALAASGPLVAKICPTYLQAEERVSFERLVVLRARVVPVVSGFTVRGDLSRSIPLAWSQTRISLQPRAQVAAHGSLRQLMEGVGLAEPVAQRPRPLSTVEWWVQLCYTSWRGDGVGRDVVVNAERALFQEIDADPVLCANGQVYNAAVSQRVTDVASSLNATVSASFPCVARLDYPHQWLWASDRPDLNDLTAGGDAIASHLTRTFAANLEAIMQRPQQWVVTQWHHKPAILQLQKLRAATP